MHIKADTIEEYIQQLPEERQPVISKIREVIITYLPEGFLETISYGMIGYVVPHSIYPSGYHVDPKLPLPFINLASQKNYIALYHSGVYADPDMLDWLVSAYPKHSKTKLDMGKSCIRFKKIDQVPYELIGELISKMSVDEWIQIYEENVKRR